MANTVSSHMATLHTKAIFHRRDIKMSEQRHVRRDVMRDTDPGVVVATSTSVIFTENGDSLITTCWGAGN